MKLSQVLPGQKFIIYSLPQGKVHAQIIRFGIDEGTEVECVEVIPGGPVVIEHKRQEIAIGRKLAEAIVVDVTKLSSRSKRSGGVA